MGCCLSLLFRVTDCCRFVICGEGRCRLLLSTGTESMQFVDRLSAFIENDLSDYIDACIAVEVLSGTDYVEYYKGFWKGFDEYRNGIDVDWKAKTESVCQYFQRIVTEKIPESATDQEKIELAKIPDSGVSCLEMLKRICSISERNV